MAMSFLNNKIARWCEITGHLVGWLLLPLMMVVILGVIGSHLGVHYFAKWSSDVTILGAGITLNSLLDLQWYCFAVLVLWGAIAAYVDNQHVQVDLFSNILPGRINHIVQLLGDLFFLVPMLLVFLVYGIGFTHFSWVTGESSTYGGLEQRWVIKMMLPLCSSVFLIVVFGRIFDRIVSLCQGHQTNRKAGDRHD